MARQPYPTDLSDAEWAILEPLVPPIKPGGRPALHSRREIIDGMRYILRSGCSWRLLPPGARWAFPPWQTVYHYFRLWRLNGTLEAIHTALREQLRVSLEREPTPSAAILDSQSGPGGAPTAEKGGCAATTGASR